MSEKETQSEAATVDGNEDKSDAAASATTDDPISDAGSPEAAAESNDGPGGAGSDRATPAAAGSAPGRGLAWFATLLSILALLGVAWLFVQAGSPDDPGPAVEDLTTLQADFAELERRLSSAESELAAAERALQVAGDAGDASAETRALIDRVQSELSGRIDELDTGLQAMAPTGNLQPERLDQRIDALGQRIEALETGQAAIDARVAQLGSGLQAQQGLQSEVDRDLALKLDLLEASALLALGQARIELVGDRAAAVAAYEQASERIADADDSRLVQVRERLADELARIESLAQPDWLSLGARLAEWERQVGEWPLRSDEAESIDSEAAAEEVAEQGWFSGMRESLGQLVTVERRDPLALDDELISAVREQARLHLAAAGLALERRDVGAMGLHLAQVSELINAYFDLDDEGLAEIRSDMAAMATVQPMTAPEGLGQAAAALDRVIDSL